MPQNGVPREHPRQGPGLASPGRRALRRLANGIAASNLITGTISSGSLKPLYANPTAVSTTDALEDDLMKYTLPGGTLANIGDSVMVEACIVLSGAAATKTIRFYFGVLQIAFVLANVTNNTCYYMIRVMRLSATAQQICASVSENTNVAGTGATFVAGAQTLSASQVIKFTGQGNAAGQVTQQMMNIQLSQP